MPRLAWTVLAALVVAPWSPRAAPPEAWDRTEAMVPMRDGVRLRTVAYLPRGFPERLPVREDFRPAVLTVQRSRRHPSRVTFPSPDRGSTP